MCQFLQLKSKINYVFEQIPIKYQTEILDFGVGKNLKVTKEDREKYIDTYNLYNEINTYIDYKKENIVYIGSRSAMWL